MENCWRIVECGDKRGRILSRDTKPKAGVGEIGISVMAFKAEQANAYVLGAGQKVFTRRPSGVPAGPFLSRKAANFKRGFADGVGASFRKPDLSGPIRKQGSVSVWFASGDKFVYAATYFLVASLSFVKSVLTF